MPLLARWNKRGRHILTVVLGSIALVWIGLIGVRIVFPLEYRAFILTYSADNHLEPAWVASVIRNESRFRPDAVSPAGALGLMQIMPETGAWIVTQGSWPDDASQRLLDPATNIALGTWYLRYLLDRFGEREAALAAYNAGPTYVERWEGDPTKAFPETQHYIRKIGLSLPVYQVYFACPWLLALVPSLDIQH